MEFWIDVENSAGEVQGSGPVRSATGWRQVRRLNGAGTFSFDFPASDTAALGLMTAKRVVRCYAVIGGAVTEVGAGIIDEVATSWGPDGSLLATVRGSDLLGELKRVLVSFSGGDVNFDNVKYIPRLLLSVFASSLSWAIEDEAGNTLTGDVTAENVYARFRGETVLAGLVSMAEATGEFFRQGTDRVLTWIGPVSDFPASGVRAVAGAEPVALGAAAGLCAIRSFEKIIDAADWANHALVRGNGTGDVRSALLSATTWPDGLIDTTNSNTTMAWNSNDQATGQDTDAANWKVSRVEGWMENNNHVVTNGHYGVNLGFEGQGAHTNTDADIVSNANQLLRSTYHYLKARSVTPVFYRLAVAGLDKIVLPGETIRVAARRFVDGSAVLNVDEDLNILETTWEVSTAGLHTVDLVVTDGQRFPDSGDNHVVEQVKKTMIFRGHPQNESVSYEIGHTEIFDNDEVMGSRPAYFPFDLGGQVVLVRSVVFKFRVDTFRSTIKSVAVVPSGGTNTEYTASTGDHTHAEEMGDDITQGGIVTFHTGELHTYGGGTLTTGEGGLHNHSMPHVHDTAASLSAGIAEISPTAGTENLTIQINGSDPSNSTTGPDGNGYYSLDLTADVSDGTTYRPKNVANQIVVAADEDYFGLLRARVQVNIVIQSISS